MAASDAIRDPQSPEVPVWPGHDRVPIRKRSTHGRTEAMATITLEPSGAWTADPGPLRCPRCHGALHRTDAGFDCDAKGCGASLPIRDGVLVVRDDPTDDNKIAADFYNSKLWPKVRFWERIFWVLNGGERRARDVVLRTPAEVPRRSSARRRHRRRRLHELASRGLVDRRHRHLRKPARRLPAP